MCWVDFFILIGIILAVIQDIKNKSIGISIIVVMTVLVAIKRFFYNSAVDDVGGLVIGIIFIIISVLSRQAFGLGDSIMMLQLGVGYGVEKLVSIIMISFTLTFIVGASLLLTKKRNMKYEMPFLPYMLIGVVITCLTS